MANISPTIFDVIAGIVKSISALCIVMSSSLAKQWATPFQLENQKNQRYLEFDAKIKVHNKLLSNVDTRLNS